MTERYIIRAWRDPGRMRGTLCVEGTRVPVDVIADYLSEPDTTLTDLVKDFPSVTAAILTIEETR